MSNEHLDRIRELCSDALWADDAGPALDKILDHAKAMAAGLDYERKRADKAKAETGKIATECSELAKALAEAEARIHRLQCYAEHLELYLEDSGLHFGFDARRGCEDYRDHCGIQPGDMPNTEDDSADATPPESVTIRNDDGTTSTFHVFGQLSAEGDDE